MSRKSFNWILLSFSVLTGWANLPTAAQTIHGWEESSLVTLHESARRAKDGRSSSLPSPKSIPHIALGGLWNTHFTVVNTHKTKWTTVTLAFWTSSGSRMTVRLWNGRDTESGNTFRISLPPLGTMRLTPVDLPTQVMTGWVEIGYEDTSSATVFATFRATVPGRPDYEALVTAGSGTSDTILIPFDNRNGFDTAVAIVNPWSSLTTTLLVEVLDENGVAIASYQEGMSPRNQTAVQFRRRSEASSNRAGAIAIRVLSGPGVNALALLFNPSGSVTTIPSLESDTH